MQPQSGVASGNTCIKYISMEMHLKYTFTMFKTLATNLFLVLCRASLLTAAIAIGKNIKL